MSDAPAPGTSDANAESLRRLALRADCARCVGLCCVAPAFAASADFALDKPAGQPCRNLLADSRCGIHTRLHAEGFPGCSAYDCFGAGQQVTQVTFGGRDWRDSPAEAKQMFGAFSILRHLHELLWHLMDAERLSMSEPLLGQITEARLDIERLTALPPEELSEVDGSTHHEVVSDLLRRASRQVRADAFPGGADLSGTDHAGADLRAVDLRGASLRGAVLIRTNLRGIDLAWTDLLGADLRAADLRGTRLVDSFFLTQAQVSSAVGDASTTLPPWTARPAHWSSDQGAPS